MKYSILGSGAIGTALARRFAARRIDVSRANAGGPDSLAALIGEVGSKVLPVSAAEALQAEIVILVIPFDAVADATKGVDWDGRNVVDATNAIDLPSFAPRDLSLASGNLRSTLAAPGRMVKVGPSGEWRPKQPKRRISHGPQEARGDVTNPRYASGTRELLQPRRQAAQSP